MAENEENSDTQVSGFIPEVLIIEQHNDIDESDNENKEEEEEEEDFSELPSSTELAENVSDSDMYENLEIAINQQRRISRPKQKNNYRGQQANSSCCLLI